MRSRRKRGGDAVPRIAGFGKALSSHLRRLLIVYPEMKRRSGRQIVIDRHKSGARRADRSSTNRRGSRVAIPPMPLLSFLFCSSWFSDAAAAADSAIISRDDRPRSFLRDRSSRRSRPDARDVRQCSRTRFHRDFRTDIGRKGGKRASHSVDQRETLKTVSRFSRLFARHGPFDVSHRTGPSD